MFRDPAPLLRARTVAIVGASERARWPVQIHANLTGAGAAARIVPVNPGRDEVWGLKCYPDLASLPEAPDTALMIVPAAHIVPALAQGAKHGLKSALIYASEMGEGSAPESIARGRALATLCEDTGLVVCGPNCMGSSSVREKLFFYPPIGHEEVAPGPVGVIFHSGGSLQYIARAGAARGLGFSYMISSGNEISLDAADYINFLVEDEHTRIIAMFIEGIRRPEAFMEAARRALAAGKPILAVKAGRTDEARRAALSHTGAIAGDYEVFAALCERYGIVLCAALDDLVETALAFQARTLPRGERIAVIANSGGVVDLLYDHAADEGIRLAKLSAKTARSLRPLVGPAMEIRNPMDCGAAGFADMENYARVGETVVADDGVDLLLFENRAPDRRGNRPPEPFRRLAENAGKPVLAFTRMRHPLTDAGRAFQESVGIPFLQSMPETLRAARALVFYGKRQGRRIPVLPAARGRRSTATGDGLARALRAHGLPAPRSAFALLAAEAARAAAKIGFPVALKIVSAAISHKTEAGGVVLNVGSAAAVKR